MGRISMTKNNFFKIGGYNQSLKNCYGNYNYNNLMKVNMIYSDFSLKSGELIANNFFFRIIR